MVIRSLNLETVCGITSKLPENHLRVFPRHQERHRRLIFTILMKNYIW